LRKRLLALNVEAVRGGEEALTTVFVLADDVRRGLYGVVRRAGRPVSRDEAAAAVGISRKLAAFHLDKLVAAGLLRAHFARPSGGLRRPGRTPKLYEPSDVEVAVTIPARQYDLLAEILLDAVRSGNRDARAAVRRAARERGLRIGREARERLRPGRLGLERAMRLVEQVLAEHGYEPASAHRQLRLLNCPFHQLVANDRELVCGLNHALLQGVLEGLGADTLDAALAAEDGVCCVAIRPATRKAAPR
jgi:predicted ArsR family transcriptional regulator